MSPGSTKSPIACTSTTLYARTNQDIAQNQFTSHRTASPNSHAQGRYAIPGSRCRPFRPPLEGREGQAPRRSARKPWLRCRAHAPRPSGLRFCDVHRNAASPNPNPVCGTAGSLGHGPCPLSFFRVLHRPLRRRPPVHETVICCLRVVDTEVGLLLGAHEPVSELDPGPSSAPDCRHGLRAPEHVS